MHLENLPGWMDSPNVVTLNESRYTRFPKERNVGSQQKRE